MRSILLFFAVLALAPSAGQAQTYYVNAADMTNDGCYNNGFRSEYGTYEYAGGQSLRTTYTIPNGRYSVYWEGRSNVFDWTIYVLTWDAASSLASGGSSVLTLSDGGAVTSTSRLIASNVLINSGQINLYVEKWNDWDRVALCRFRIVKTGTYLVPPACTSSISNGATIPSGSAVSLYNSQSGAQIVYKFKKSTEQWDNSGDPPHGGTFYTAPLVFTVTTPTTYNLRFGARQDGFGPMSEISFTVAPTKGMPTVNPATGTYTGSVTVTASSPDGGQVRYTTNGSDPTDTSPVFSGSETYSSTVTVKFINTQTGYTSSPVVSRTYTLQMATASAPTVAPATGSYSTDVAVTAVGVGTIRYTTDGSEPTTSSPVWTNQTITQSKTMKFKAFVSGQNPSATVTRQYSIEYLPTQSATVEPASGEYESPLEVTVTNQNGSQTSRYTIDGSDVTEFSTVYTTPIVLTGAATVKVKTFQPGFLPSLQVTRNYTVREPRENIGKVTFSPPLANQPGTSQSLYAYCDSGHAIRYRVTYRIATSGRVTAGYGGTLYGVGQSETGGLKKVTFERPSTGNFEAGFADARNYADWVRVAVKGVIPEWPSSLFDMAWKNLGQGTYPYDCLEDEYVTPWREYSGKIDLRAPRAELRTFQGFTVDPLRNLEMRVDAYGYSPTGTEGAQSSATVRLNFASQECPPDASQPYNSGASSTVPYEWYTSFPLVWKSNGSPAVKPANWYGVGISGRPPSESAEIAARVMYLKDSCGALYLGIESFVGDAALSAHSDRSNPCARRINVANGRGAISYRIIIGRNGAVQVEMYGGNLSGDPAEGMPISGYVGPTPGATGWGTSKVMDQSWNGSISTVNFQSFPRDEQQRIQCALTPAVIESCLANDNPFARPLNDPNYPIGVDGGVTIRVAGTYDSPGPGQPMAQTTVLATSSSAARARDVLQALKTHWQSGSYDWKTLIPQCAEGTGTLENPNGSGGATDGGTSPAYDAAPEIPTIDDDDDDGDGLPNWIDPNKGDSKVKIDIPRVQDVTSRIKEKIVLAFGAGMSNPSEIEAKPLRVTFSWRDAFGLREVPILFSKDEGPTAARSLVVGLVEWFRILSTVVIYWWGTSTAWAIFTGEER